MKNNAITEDVCYPLTEDMYCPLHGFNPPCGRCMWAISENESSIACAIAALSLIASPSLSAKNIVKAAE